MKKIISLLALSLAWSSTASADQVIFDDHIVQGSSCVGTDCVNGESFGFYTTILKENNTRLHFQDTSTSASFPTNDWTLVANDSNNGGRSQFSIVDADRARELLTLLAGAPDQALVVGERGVGLGTVPDFPLHLLTGDSPTIRLQQDGTQGWTPFSWDVGANESNLFVRDAENNTLPFAVLAAAGDDTLVVAPLGVGIGTKTPTTPLHVVSAVELTPGATVGQLTLENSATGGAVLMSLEANGPVESVYTDAASSTTWREVFGEDPDNGGEAAYTLGVDGQPTAIVVTASGNIRIPGTVTTGSSRTLKRGFIAVVPRDVLARLASIPLSRWQYKRDAAGAIHLGPMAEDFHAAFGLGEDARSIAPSDMAGVALAAVQGLNQKVDSQAAEIRDLKKKNDDLEVRLKRLEAAVGQLAK